MKHLKVCFIGCGDHAKRFILPALLYVYLFLGNLCTGHASTPKLLPHGPVPGARARTTVK